MATTDTDMLTPIAVSPSRLGESPLWHPEEGVLYWCDIPAHRLNRYNPRNQVHEQWEFESDLACCAPLLGAGLLLALRDGLWRFDPRDGVQQRVAKAPYDSALERFNDGKADPQGRFWVGTIYEPRDPALAALYRCDKNGLRKMADGITVSNGLAWSPDGGTMYWTDTKAHTVYAFDFDPGSGSLSNRRVFAAFPGKSASAALEDYGGRPDGAAMDAEGCYWVAMFEGARVLRLSPRGEVLRQIDVPAQCPTMPCFGGPDLRTLYVTTASDKRPPAELRALPFSGCVFSLRVDVPGMPANFCRF